MSVSFNPIGPWLVVVVAALVVTVLTVWAYQQRLHGTSGRWRWFALGLRLAAVLLCVLAAFRPSVIVQEKKKQASILVFLIDDSSSMKLTDEANGASRWSTATAAFAKARAATAQLGPNLGAKFYRFSSTIREQMADDKSGPEGKETALGAALLEAIKRQEGLRVTAVVVVSDGGNNSGLNPLVEARRLRSQQIVVSTVGVGSESAGPASRDVSVREIITSPTVFVKNQLQVRGVLVVRGFPNKPIDVELLVEGQTEPVASVKLKAPEGSELVPLTGLKYIPQTPGEKKLTIRVKPIEGELVQDNNEVSTFVTVLSGGLNVLFVHGPHSPWEPKFFLRAVATSPDIQADLRVVRKPADGEKGELADLDFAPGKYNVYVLSDLPADHLTRTQQQLLARAVEKGAGLIMLGGRSSFGPGGWADTPIARVLPVDIHPGDSQVEPEGGLKFVPNLRGPENFLFQVGPNRAESQRVWEALPNLTGTNQFGSPKHSAMILAQAPGRDGAPLMVGISPGGNGRVLAFGGETWVWARGSDEGRAAHRKFWRQIIFWLARKEDQGENKITLALDRRRLAVGEKLELTVTARDAKNAPLSGVTYETKVAREAGGGVAEAVTLFDEGEQARGPYLALGQAGEYKATVTAFRDGKELGHDSARFLVYQDDREMENPAADLALLRQVAETTGGTFLPPEDLPKYLKKLNGKVDTDYVTQTEHKIWDNWPFLLIFTALLTLEWWLRKRHGWV